MNIRLFSLMVCAALAAVGCSSPAPAPTPAPAPEPTTAPEAPAAPVEEAAVAPVEEAPAASEAMEEEHATHEEHAEHEDEHDHVHEAPRGGALIELGDHAGNVELLLDGESGKLSLYALDAHAENPVRLAIAELPIVVIPDGAEPLDLVLTAQASSLTGETVGDTSEFGLTDERLKGVSKFTGTIPKLEMLGGEFANVAISFPEGIQ